MNEDIKNYDMSALKKDIDFQALKSVFKHHVSILIVITGIIFFVGYSLKADIRDNKAELKDIKADIHSIKIALKIQ